MNALRNNVQLIGNLGNSPELKTLDSGSKRVKFNMATNESYTNLKGEKVTETQWHNIIAWGKTAELMTELLDKGKLVLVSGKITSRTYEDNEGIKRIITEIVASEFLLLSPKSENIPF